MKSRLKFLVLPIFLSLLIVGCKSEKIGSEATFVEFQVPTQKSEPQAIAIDSQGKVWFTESAADKIGRLDPVNGEKSESPIPTAGSPAGLAIDSDGNIWFVETFAGKIGKLVSGANPKKENKP